METLSYIVTKYQLNKVFSFLTLLFATLNLFDLINIFVNLFLVLFFAICAVVSSKLNKNKEDYDFFMRNRKYVFIGTLLAIIIISFFYFYNRN